MRVASSVKASGVFGKRATLRGRLRTVHSIRLSPRFCQLGYYWVLLHRERIHGLIELWQCRLLVRVRAR